MVEQYNKKICEENIYPVTEKEYGVHYKEHFFRLYQMYIESVAYTSNMKLRLNRFFLAINTALLAAIGISASRDIISLDTPAIHMSIPVGGIAVALIWWATIYSYKQRNVIKLHIIHCLEKHLPLSLYSTEWKLMQADHNSFKQYFFRIELVIPWVFIALYTFLFFI